MLTVPIYIDVPAAIFQFDDVRKRANPLERVEQVPLGSRANPQLVAELAIVFTVKDREP